MISEDPDEVAEDRTLSLAEYLNSNRIYPQTTAFGGGRLAGRFEYDDPRVRKLKATGNQYWAEMINIELADLRSLGDAIPGTGTAHGTHKRTSIKGKPLKIIGASLWQNNRGICSVYHELIEGEDHSPLFATMAEGAGQFEGQFAWYNEDLISREQIWPLAERRNGLCWEEGKPPRRYFPMLAATPLLDTIDEN